MKLDKQNPENSPYMSTLLNRMVGSANEGEINIFGVNTSGLIDSGSMVSSISETFYNSLEPLP